MRIALFGGTFDPPHRGHLSIARAAADRFALDRILFAPTAKQPLKGTTSASFEDRFAMVELAVSADTRFAASRIDGPNADGSPNYTVDTLSRLSHELSGESEAEKKYCITGADAFLDIKRWREPSRLFELADWIVVSRPGFSLSDLSPLALTPQQLTRVHLLEGIHEDISATRLRADLAAGKDIAANLPPGVANYIRQHHLYI